MSVMMFWIIFFTSFTIISASLNVEEVLPKYDVNNMWESTDNTKVIVDTDGGVDDAMALLMGLVAQDVEIIAVTVTSGVVHLEQAVVNIHKALRVVKSQVQVHPGADKPFLPGTVSDKLYGEDGFGDVPYPFPPTTDEAEKEHAVSFMIRMVKQNPHQIVIIALGPLTNLALAMRLDYEFKKSVKSIFWTGGNMYAFGDKHAIEFNAYFDPIATFICLNESGPPIVMLPWETLNLHSELPRSWRLDELGTLKSSQISFFNVLENVTLSTNDRWVARDQKTMAIAINPRIITKMNAYYVTSLAEGDRKGLTLVDIAKTSGNDPNVVIIEKIDVSGLKDTIKHYLRVKMFD